MPPVAPIGVSGSGTLGRIPAEAGVDLVRETAAGDRRWDIETAYPTVCPGTARLDPGKQKDRTLLEDCPATLAFHLFGRVGAADFPAWMQRHSAKLGVKFTINQQLPHRVSVEATGAMEMLNAFALACSLGPQSVCIERLVVLEAAPHEASTRPG